MRKLDLGKGRIPVSTYHGTPKNPSKGDIFTEDDSIIVFGQRNAHRVTDGLVGVHLARLAAANNRT
jgi:hypothetical protein